MVVITLVTLGFFVWAYLSAMAEPPSVDSGTNLLVTAIMVLIIFIMVSFSTLTTIVAENYLQVKFGYGIFKKKFLLTDIASVKQVRNSWLYGWGIRLWLWPKMWVYNVYGLKAIEIVMKDGKIYRIGTDVPGELETTIKQATNL